LAELLGQIGSSSEKLFRTPENAHLRHLSIEGFLLEHGELFSRPASPSTRFGETQACFMNAGAIALTDSQWTYIEGYALIGDIQVPIHHAWLVSVEGELWDPTWDEPGSAYFGVPIKEEFLSRTVAEQECYGLFESGDELSRLVAGLENDFKATVCSSPASELFRQTARHHWNADELTPD
jgi:hypothetical protein